MRRYVAICILGLLIVGCTGGSEGENNGGTADTGVDTVEDTDESDSMESDADTGQDVMEPPEPDWDGVCAIAEYDRDETPTPEMRMFRTFDEQGRIIEEAQDVGADGSIDRVVKTVYHDVGTNQVTRAAYASREADLDGDGTMDVRKVWDYDSGGRMLHEKWDIDIDDSFEFVAEFAYDEYGHLTSYSRDGDKSSINSWALIDRADGQANYEKVFTWDGDGLPLTKKWDTDGDGEFEAVSTWVYGSPGQLDERTVDGTVNPYAQTSGEFGVPVPDPRLLDEADGDVDVRVQVTEWTEDGQPAVERFDGWRDTDGEFFERADGTFDREVRYTYDEGNPTRREFDVDLDGTPDVTIDRTLYVDDSLTEPYIISQSIDGVFNNDLQLVEAQDGTANDVGEFEYYFPSYGGWMNDRHRDIGNDGTDELVQEYSFDQYGRVSGYMRDGDLAVREFETDNPADGVPDYAYTTEYDSEGRERLIRWEQNGELLAKIELEYMSCDEI